MFSKLNMVNMVNMVSMVNKLNMVTIIGEDESKPGHVCGKAFT